MRIRRLLAALPLLALSAAVSAKEPTKQELKRALEKNPDVLLDVLKENRKALFEIVTTAAAEEQMRRQKDQAERQKREFEDSFKNPLKPSITRKTRVRGRKNAKYTLVEYSDFQCPYCARGYRNVETLRKKYGKDMRFVYKHLPLDFHPQAMPAAKYMEAASLQSEEKAWEFHDRLFENQDKLGEEFYKETAKELGLDLKRLERDLKSKKVAERIEADMAEAKSFGFSGTPGFLLNGIPVRGAYPVEHFEQIIGKLEGRSGSGSK